MNLFAATLVVLGILGYALAWSESTATGGGGDTENATAAAPSITPLVFTLGPAAIMAVMAFMSRRIEHSKAVGMIGIHLGMLLPLAFAIAYAVVGWSRFTKWQAGEKPLASVLLFLAMVLSSLVATAAIIAARPAKADRGAA